MTSMSLFVSVAKENEQKANERVVAAQAKSATSFYGSMKITDVKWKASLDDPSSSDYKQMKNDFEKAVS